MGRTIRIASVADGAAFAEIYRPAVTESATSFEIVPPGAAEMSRRIEKRLELAPWLAYDIDGAVAGYAYASAFRDRAAYQWSVEVSAYVLPGARGQGVARSLYETLFRLLAMQGFRNAYAGITLPNAASVGLHSAVGFSPVGVYRNVGYKDGAWHDVAWYERELSVPLSPPPLPTPLSDDTIRSRVQWMLSTSNADSA
jgi:L-amino acid N-acyltransferase YncA